MKFSMTGQEKGDLLIQVTAWAGLTEQRVFKPVPVELLTSSTAMLQDWGTKRVSSSVVYMFGSERDLLKKRTYKH